VPDAPIPPLGGVNDPVLSPIKQEDTFNDYESWSNARGMTTEEPVESIKNYADYVREWHLNTGELTDEIDASINTALLQKAQQIGAIGTPDVDPDFEANAVNLVGARDISSDRKISLVRQALGDLEADNFSQKLETDPTDPYVNNRLNEAKALLVRTGEIPFATISSIDGNERSIIGGPASRGAHLGDAFKRSAMAGTVSYADAAQALRFSQTKNSDGLNVFEQQELSELMVEMAAAKADKSNYDVMGGALKDVKEAISKADKINKEFIDTPYKSIEDAREALQRHYSKTRNSYGAKAHGRFSDRDIGRALQVFAAQDLNHSGAFEFYDDPEEDNRNIRMFGGVPMAHPTLMLRRDRFESAVDKDTRLTDEQRISLKQRRQAYVAGAFDHYKDILDETSATGSKWRAALQAGRVKGTPDVDILDNFLADPENYSHFKNQLTQFGSSIEASIAQLWSFPAQIFGSSSAREYNEKEAKEDARRREVAALFGEEFSWVLDAAGTASAVVVDALVSLGLAAFTGGVVGLGYLSTQAGSRVTAKGLAKKSMGLTLLKPKFYQSPKQLADDLIANNLIKTSGTDAAKVGVEKAIEAYTRAMSNRFMRQTTMAIPWGTRSGGGMFVSVYGSLPDTMTHEEKHAIALGAGLKAAASTILITSAFSKMGLGGFEDSLLNRGLSYKEMKQVLTKLSGQKVGNKEAEALIKSRMAEAIHELDRPFNKGVGKFLKARAKDALPEGMEEGLDEFVQSFIEAAALDEERPLIEHINRALVGARAGALIGGTLTPAMRAVNRFATGAGIKDAESYERDQIQNIISTLEENDSPLAAAELRNWTRTALARGPREALPPRPEGAPSLEEDVEAEATEITPPVEEDAELIPASPAKQKHHRQVNKTFANYYATDGAAILPSVLPRITDEAELQAARNDADYNIDSDGVIYGVRIGGTWVGFPTRKATRKDSPETLGQDEMPFIDEVMAQGGPSPRPGFRRVKRKTIIESLEKDGVDEDGKDKYKTVEREVEDFEWVPMFEQEAPALPKAYTTESGEVQYEFPFSAALDRPVEQKIQQLLLPLSEQTSLPLGEGEAVTEPDPSAIPEFAKLAEGDERELFERALEILSDSIKNEGRIQSKPVIDWLDNQFERNGTISPQLLDYITQTIEAAVQESGTVDSEMADFREAIFTSFNTSMSLMLEDRLRKKDVAKNQSDQFTDWQKKKEEDEKVYEQLELNLSGKGQEDFNNEVTSARQKIKELWDVDPNTFPEYVKFEDEWPDVAADISPELLEKWKNRITEFYTRYLNPNLFAGEPISKAEDKRYLDHKNILNDYKNREGAFSDGAVENLYDEILDAERFILQAYDLYIQNPEGQSIIALPKEQAGNQILIVEDTSKINFEEGVIGDSQFAFNIGPIKRLEEAPAEDEAVIDDMTEVEIGVNLEDADSSTEYAEYLYFALEEVRNKEDYDDEGADKSVIETAGFRELASFLRDKNATDSPILANDKLPRASVKILGDELKRLANIASTADGYASVVDPLNNKADKILANLEATKPTTPTATTVIESKIDRIEFGGREDELSLDVATLGLNIFGGHTLEGSDTPDSSANLRFDNALNAELQVWREEAVNRWERAFEFGNKEAMRVENTYLAALNSGSLSGRFGGSFVGMSFIGNLSASDGIPIALLERLYSDIKESYEYWRGAKEYDWSLPDVVRRGKHPEDVDLLRDKLKLLSDHLSEVRNDPSQLSPNSQEELPIFSGNTDTEDYHGNASWKKVEVNNDLYIEIDTEFIADPLEKAVIDQFVNYLRRLKVEKVGEGTGRHIRWRATLDGETLTKDDGSEAIFKKLKEAKEFVFNDDNTQPPDELTVLLNKVVYEPTSVLPDPKYLIAYGGTEYIEAKDKAEILARPDAAADEPATDADAVFDSKWSIARLEDEYNIAARPDPPQAYLDGARLYFRNGYELGLSGDAFRKSQAGAARPQYSDAFREGYESGRLQYDADETLETSIGSYEPSPNSVYSTHLSGDDGGDHIQPLLSGANSTEERQAILSEWTKRNPLASAQLSSFMTKWARIMAYRPIFVTKKEDGTSVYTYHEDWEAMVAEESERLRKENPDITEVEAYDNAAKSLIGDDYRERMRYASLLNSAVLGGFEETRMPSGYKEDEIPILDEPDMYFGINSSVLEEYKQEAETNIREEYNLSLNSTLVGYEEYIRLEQQRLAEVAWSEKMTQNPTGVMAEADAPLLVKAISSVLAIAESPGSPLNGRGLNTDISTDSFKKVLEMADEAAPFSEFVEFLESDEMFGESEATQEAINGILNYLGYDSVIDLRAVDPMQPSGMRRDTPATLVVFDSRRVKSGNPITFDDDGQIILPEDRIDLRDYDERRTQVAAFESTTPPPMISGTHNGMEAIAADDSENTATDIKRRVNDNVGLALDVASSNGVNTTVVRSLDYAPGGSKQNAPPMWAKGNMVYINPYGVARAISGLQDKDALHLSVTMVSEEMAHVASWNVLTRAEVQEVIDSLGDGDFTDIADEYYQDQSSKEASFARLNSPDPTVSGKEKYRLIEEKMRMHAQRVVRGFTTEEDNKFFRSNPNLLQRAIRYMKGFLRRLLELRKVQRQNPHLARATDRIVTQLRMMRGNFKAPDIEPFDVNNPESGMVALATQIDSTAELNDTSMIPVKYDEDDNIIQQPYDLLGSPLLTGKGFRNKGARDFTKPDYVELPYAVIKPDRAKVEAAIDSGAIDRAAALLAKQAEESLSDPELPEDIGQARFGVWGARSLRRLLYKAPVKASQSRWRIQPPAEQGISGGDLLAAELIFNRAAKQLDMKPEELHAVMQFAEKKIWTGNGWVDDAKQDVWSYPTDQEVSSAATAMNVSKLPKTFALLDKQGVKWESGSINADIGGGSFDNVTEALEKLGVVNYVYDPFNRTSEENREAVSAIRDGQADTATVNNVLNVIKEEEARELVIKQAANAIGRGGKAYFLIYEKDGDGVGKDTSRGWQNNRKAETYIPEIKKHFGEVTRKGTLITASPKTEDIILHTSISLVGVPDDASEAIENIRSLGTTAVAFAGLSNEPVTAVRPSSLGFPKEWDAAYDSFKEVAERGGLPIGVENIYFKVKPGVNYKNEVELSLLWVPHTMQRKGVAKALLKALFKKADETGAMVSALAKAYTTDGLQGKELVSFYQRAGMTGVGSMESQAITDPEGFIADTIDSWQDLRDNEYEDELDWRKADDSPLTSEEQRVLTTSPNEYYSSTGSRDRLTLPLIDPVPTDAELEIAVRRKQKDEAARHYIDEGLQIYRPYRGKKDAAPESLYPDLYTSIGVTPEQDARYLELAQNEDANMGELQQMVDERAKAAGFFIDSYHGTKSKGFTVFDKRKRGTGIVGSNSSGGFYFSYSRDGAEYFADGILVEKDSDVELGEDTATVYGGEDGGVYYLLIEDESGEVQINAGPYTTEAKAESAGKSLIDKWNKSEIGDEVYQQDNVMHTKLKMTNPKRVGDGMSFRTAERTAKAEGYDGIIATDIVDGGVSHDVFVVFEPNQIKSADPVTRDADGNVIPLSQRFDEGQESILYTSIGDTDLWDSQDPNAAEFPDWNLDIGKLDEPRMRGITMRHTGVSEATAPAGERLHIQRYPSFLMWDTFSFDKDEDGRPQPSISDPVSVKDMRLLNNAPDTNAPTIVRQAHKQKKLNELRYRGALLDDMGFDANTLQPEDIRVLGQSGRRTIVEVSLPEGMKQVFYLSSGRGRKAGIGGTTAGQWQPFGGFMDNISPRSGNVIPRWFIKDVDYLTLPDGSNLVDKSADWLERNQEIVSQARLYGSASFTEISERLDELVEKAAPDKPMWISGGINAAIGGGASQEATNILLNRHGVTNVVYDPANRSPEHNEEAAKLIRGGQADTATVASVMNSGVSEDVRAHAIELAADAIKPNGSAYFWVTEHAANRYAESYRGFVNQVKKNFGEVISNESTAYKDGERIGSYDRLIVARKPIKELDGEEPVELASSIGSRPPTDEEILNATEFRHVLDLFDLPVLKAGGYKKPFKYKFMRWLAGSLDPRVRSLDDQRKFMMNQSLRTVTKFHENLKAQTIEAYGSLGKAPIKVIAAAIGNTRGARPSSADAKRIEDYVMQGVAAIDAKLKEQERIAKKGDITYKEVREARKQAKQQKALLEEEANAEYAVLTEQDRQRIIRDRADALDLLRNGNDTIPAAPELVDTLDRMRKYIDALSVKVKQLYGVSPELEARIDDQLGIYLTRSYRIFNESGWADKVLTDPSEEFQRIREKGEGYFREQFINAQTAMLLDKSRRDKSKALKAKDEVAFADAEMSASEAAAMAEAQYNALSEGNRTHGQQQVEAFIEAYRNKGYMPAGLAGKSEGYKPLTDNLKRKKDLDPRLQELLGVYGEESFFDNMFRTFMTLSTMAANQNFLVRVAEMGREQGWLLTQEELNKKAAEDPDTYGGGNYVAVRPNVSSNDRKPNTLYDPFVNYIDRKTGEELDYGKANVSVASPLFAPKEFKEAMEKTFEPSMISQMQDEASEVAQTLHKIASRATGLSMATKTLGSVGFYVRNIASNMLFFAPAQGFFSYRHMTKHLIKEGRRTLRWSSPEKIDSYYAELDALGVIGDELRPSVLKELVMGETTPETMMKDLDTMLADAEGNKALKQSKKFVEKLQELSRSVDAFYKIAYFEHELDVLRKAQRKSRDAGISDSISELSESELKREAARKVLMTAQSYSQAPPFVKGALKSWYGVVFAPFLRFKIEVPRIMINTGRLIWEEIKSDNSVIRNRGYRRLSGFTFAVGGLGTGMSYLISHMFGGLTDEEEEANRASMPHYLRSHTFITYKRDGELRSLDLTYINPFATMLDPMMRAFPEIMRGDVPEATREFMTALFANQFLDEQIMFGTIQSMIKNKNPDTDQPIVEATDSAEDALYKWGRFLFSEAIVPPSVERIGKGSDIMQLLMGDNAAGNFDPIFALGREFYPAREYTIKPVDQLERYLRTRSEEMKRAKMLTRRLRWENISDEDVRKIAQTDVEKRKRINKDMQRMFKGFESMGIPEGKIYDIAKSKNFGKRRLALLHRGYMERPVLSKEFQRELVGKGEEYARRLQIFTDEVNKMPRFIPLDD
tara:strand:- start:7362 stop:22625 length:15264 start_codon:yes stop_codon:yes gene_type:complete